LLVNIKLTGGFLLSGALLASLPVIILFIFIGKYFISGLTEGAVK